jgi:hypothetical protein
MLCSYVDGDFDTTINFWVFEPLQDRHSKGLSNQVKLAVMLSADYLLLMHMMMGNFQVPGSKHGVTEAFLNLLNWLRSHTNSTAYLVDIDLIIAAF